MATTNLRKIYIAADALWDLRQGTLAFLDPAFAADVTSQPEYYTRDEDIFSANGDTLSKNIFARVFEKRKHEILRTSVKTEILEFVGELCKQYIKQIVESPFLNDLEIEINLYPFILSQSEKDALMECFREVFRGSMRIELVHIAPNLLTMKKVQSTYAAMVMYNYHDWLNLHTEELKKTNIKDVGLYVPRLYFLNKEKITHEMRQELKARGKNEFEMMTELLGALINIQFLPIAFFSASTPANLPEFRKLVREA